MKLTDVQREQVITLTKEVQSTLCRALEQVDGEAKCSIQSWERPGEPGASHAGGGSAATIRGKVVEKSGVNVSAVSGPAYPAIDGEHKGKPFFAAGVSTITHMYNPHAPIGHMNVRTIDVGDTFWVGGGADMTPFQKYDEDTKDFHAALRDACNKYSSDAYVKFSKWCDEYFYIPHRKSIRGVGGVFFDYLNGDFPKLLEFIRLVAFAYVDIFPKILDRRKDLPFDEKLKDEQLYWRGRYAEFNLVYDRGTKFGLMTGGNIEAIFVSLPPVVKW